MSSNQVQIFLVQAGEEEDEYIEEEDGGDNEDTLDQEERLAAQEGADAQARTFPIMHGALGSAALSLFCLSSAHSLKAA